MRFPGLLIENLVDEPHADQFYFGDGSTPVSTPVEPFLDELLSNPDKAATVQWVGNFLNAVLDDPAIQGFIDSTPINMVQYHSLTQYLVINENNISPDEFDLLFSEAFQSSLDSGYYAQLGLDLMVLEATGVDVGPFAGTSDWFMGSYGAGNDDWFWERTDENLALMENGIY